MTPGERIRDLPLNENPSDSAFTYICDGVGGDGKVEKDGLLDWLSPEIYDLKPLVVLEGDSILTPDHLETSVSSYLEILLDGDRSTIPNFAVSGQTVAQMVDQYSSQGATVSPSVTGYKSWFIIDGGINDIASGTSAATIYNNLKTIWAAARSDGYLVGAWTLHNYTDNSSQNTIKEALNDLILSDLSLFDSVIRADLLFPQYNEYLFFDRIHPNAIGRKLLASFIAITIKNGEEAAKASIGEFYSKVEAPMASLYRLVSDGFANLNFTTVTSGTPTTSAQIGLLGDSNLSIKIGGILRSYFDIYGNQILTTPNAGLILTSPNGNLHQIVVSNSGVLSVNSI